MFQATCGKCGTTCEVPFRPLPGKPVFCNNCFDKGGVNTNKNIDSVKEQLDQLNEKLDRILIALLPEETKKAVLKKEEAIGKKKAKKEDAAEIEPAKPATKKAAAKKKK
jgi:CxxC-x17-CxxC domain-containing protein